ncbi:MAG: glycosyltransferase family 2 protein [Methylobacterium sp.]|nr:glycosyltransferase family 2 protein [Methylobacterium sp.]
MRAPHLPSVTVLTLTRRRPSSLRRAITSVQRQTYAGAIEHIVISDDDPDTVRALSTTVSTAKRSIRVVLEARPEAMAAQADRAYVYPRLGQLLNRGVAEAGSAWVAFLDDDNEYEPEHLSSLVECAVRTGAPAVHSGRKMFWRDGAPYLDPVFPGAPNRQEGRRIYDLMCQRGVWVRGTNILLDRVDPGEHTFRNSTVIGPHDPIFLVDQNVWMLRKSMLMAIPFPESISDIDILENTCPDDKLLESLVRLGTNISRTDQPTVKYYLGGISTHQTHDLTSHARPEEGASPHA